VLVWKPYSYRDRTHQNFHDTLVSDAPDSLI